MKGQQLFLKPEEAKFLAMAVVSMIDQINDAAKNQRANWNPEARKDFKEMITAGTALKIKLEKLGLDMRDLPEYLDGDEDTFLTKQS